MSHENQERIKVYIDGLQGLAPLAAEQGAAIDRERRLPQAIFEALADLGLFRLWLPKALGGPELSPIEFMAVVEAAAALDGSIGWVAGNGGGMSRVGGYLPEATVRDWFANPRAFVASSTGAVGKAVPADGGVRVSGRWPFSSGAHHATHFMGLCNVIDASGGDSPPVCCYFARKDVTIHDTWHVSGLRGTGSCEFEANDVFVPAPSMHDFISLAPTQPGVLYRVPGVPAFRWTVMVVPLGIARGAIAAFSEMAKRKTRAGTAAPLQDREIVQAMVGRANALHGAARSFLIEAMGELLDAIEAGGDRLLRARARLGLAGTHAAESCVRILDMLAAEAGAVAIFETCPLERALRDVHATAKHIAMGPNNYALAGRIALGLDTGTARF